MCNWWICFYLQYRFTITTSTNIYIYNTTTISPTTCKVFFIIAKLSLFRVENPIENNFELLSFDLAASGRKFKFTEYIRHRLSFKQFLIQIPIVFFLQKANLFIEFIFHFWLIESSTLHHTWSKYLSSSNSTLWRNQLKNEVVR